MHRPEPILEPELLDLPTHTVAVIYGENIPLEKAPEFYDPSYRALGALINEGVLIPQSAGLAVMLSPPTDTMDVAVGFVVDDDAALPLTHVRADGTEVLVQRGTLPAGATVAFSHVGSFDGLSAAWMNLMEWVESKKLVPNGPAWELYVTEPSPDMDPAQLRTDLFIPVDQPL